jgi:hypothetical protein
MYFYPGYSCVAIAYGALTFVTAASDDIWTSRSSEVNWTRPGFAEGYPQAIAFGNGVFIIVGYDSWPDISSTGFPTNWTEVADTNIDNPAPGHYAQVGSDIAFGNGMFLVVRGMGLDGDNPLITTNGQVWRSRSILTNVYPQSVAFGNNTFVVVGPNGIYQSLPVNIPGMASKWIESSNAVDLTISGEVGQAYRLQISSNLTDWSNYWSFTNTAPTMDFIDPVSTTTPQRYYRVVSP